MAVIDDASSCDAIVKASQTIAGQNRSPLIVALASWRLTGTFTDNLALMSGWALPDNDVLGARRGAIVSCLEDHGIATTIDCGSPKALSRAADLHLVTHVVVSSRLQAIRPALPIFRNIARSIARSPRTRHVVAVPIASGLRAQLHGTSNGIWSA